MTKLGGEAGPRCRFPPSPPAPPTKCGWDGRVYQTAEPCLGRWFFHQKCLEENTTALWLYTHGTGSGLTRAFSLCTAVRCGAPSDDGLVVPRVHLVISY